MFVIAKCYCCNVDAFLFRLSSKYCCFEQNFVCFGCCLGRSFFFFFWSKVFCVWFAFCHFVFCIVPHPKIDYMPTFGFCEAACFLLIFSFFVIDDFNVFLKQFSFWLNSEILSWKLKKVLHNVSQVSSLDNGVSRKSSRNLSANVFAGKPFDVKLCIFSPDIYQQNLYSDYNNYSFQSWISLSPCEPFIISNLTSLVNFRTEIT